MLVKIKAVSLNYRDTEVCTGTYQHHQSLSGAAAAEAVVPCSDMCGEVVENKSKDSRFPPGTRVMAIFNQTHLTGQIREDDLASGLGWPLPGVLTQYRCFPPHGLVLVPGYLSDAEASCLPIASVTAWMSLNGFRPVGSPLDFDGDGSVKEQEQKRRLTVLVQGTGGVAIAGLQIAQAAGCRTIVTSSSDSKLQRATQELGASHGINHRTHWEWQEPVLEATDHDGADIIFETTGGARALRKSFQCVAFGGLIACIGYLSGKNEGDHEDKGQEQPVLDRLNVNVLALQRNATLKGILNGPRDRFEEMLAFYEKKGIRPVVDKIFKHDEAVEALTYLADAEHFGKVVIQVTE